MSDIKRLRWLAEEEHDEEAALELYRVLSRRGLPIPPFTNLVGASEKAFLDCVAQLEYEVSHRSYKSKLDVFKNGARRQIDLSVSEDDLGNLIEPSEQAQIHSIVAAEEIDFETAYQSVTGRTPHWFIFKIRASSEIYVWQGEFSSRLNLRIKAEKYLERFIEENLVPMIQFGFHRIEPGRTLIYDSFTDTESADTSDLFWSVVSRIGARVLRQTLRHVTSPVIEDKDDLFRLYGVNSEMRLRDRFDHYHGQSIYLHQDYIEISESVTAGVFEDVPVNHKLYYPLTESQIDRAIDSVALEAENLVDELEYQGDELEYQGNEEVAEDD